MHVNDPMVPTFNSKSLRFMSSLTPFQIIGGHATISQRTSLRWAVVMRVNQGTPDEAHYLIATFCDEEHATEYAQTRFFYTGVSHIVKPLNP